MQKSAREAITFVPIFLHLLTIRRLRNDFKMSLRFADDNIWLAVEKFKDRNPK